MSNRGSQFAASAQRDGMSGRTNRDFSATGFSRTRSRGYRMLFVRAGQALLLMAALLATPSFASRVHRAATSGHSHSTKARKRGRRVRRSRAVHGQRSIDAARATQIQSALIQQKYLTGAPSGQWDAQTEAAMQKYQADHGWQTKLMPDSRALISLGLGPEPAPGTSAPNSSGSSSGGGPASARSESAAPQPNTLASVHSLSQ